MVLATFFSAYATWRTALVTSTIFAVADRPFLGVQQISFQETDTQHPTIVVNFRNFGSIPALDAIVGAHAVIDGKVIKAPADIMSEMNAGILSPNVPHSFYVFIPPEKYAGGGRRQIQSAGPRPDDLQGTRPPEATLLLRAVCVRLPHEYFSGLGRRRSMRHRHLLSLVAMPENASFREPAHRVLIRQRVIACRAARLGSKTGGRPPQPG